MDLANDRIQSPIIITGVERSGSTLVARILDISGAWSGRTNKMLENIDIQHNMSSRILDGSSLMPSTNDLTIPSKFRDGIINIIKRQGYKSGPWFIKSSYAAQYWPLWSYAFPDAKWIIVRRRTGDIIQSCIKTGYMKLFKHPENRSRIGVEDEASGWLWWVHQYEEKFREMMNEGLNVNVVWPERMAVGDYRQMYETLEWVGLKWNAKIVDTINPLFAKSRR